MVMDPVLALAAISRAGPWPRSTLTRTLPTVALASTRLRHAARAPAACPAGQARNLLIRCRSKVEDEVIPATGLVRLAD